MIIRKHFTVRLNADKPRGYILLLSILVVGAVGLAVTLSLLFLGLDASRTVLVVEQVSGARALANACADEALQQIRSNSLFVGSGNMSFNGGICDYTVANTGGNTREIIASGIKNDTFSRLTINISAIYPLITYTSWQEVP
ncbi:MAG: hypothetical protein WCT16_04000 [Candidatus Buchananbacteria bacterium]